VISDVLLGHGFELVKEKLGVKLAGDLGAELFDSGHDYLIFWLLEKLSQGPGPV
jgi:hypothetical protein